MRKGDDPAEAERDRSLVRAAQEGDASAFGELYRRYMPRIYRYCLLRLPTPEDAEDATSLVFTHLIRALPRYQDRGVPFATLLFRISRNVVVSQLRRRRYRAPLEEAADVAATGEAGEPDPGALSDRVELLECLRELPDLEREVVVLRFVEGYASAEVGRIVGKSEGAVRSIQHRALEELREILRMRALAAKVGTR